MNLFSLYAKIGLDTSEYEKKIKTSQSYAKNLNKELENVSAGVDLLESMYKESVATTGRYSKETKDLSEELEKAKKRQSELREELKQTEKTAKSTSVSFEKFGSVLKNGISVIAKAGVAIAGLGVAGISALAAMSEATEEYRIAQGKLITAFENAGYSASVAGDQYQKLYSVIGDTDTAAEAAQQMAALSKSQQDLATWQKIGAGAAGVFGDALPLNNLYEAANETSRTGVLTGQLVDAIIRAGISEDEFNAKLAAAGSEAERNQLIMNTLSDAYDGAADAFYRNNKELIENRENMALLTDVAANVGKAFERAKNIIISSFVPVISRAGKEAEGFINGFSDSLEKGGLNGALDYATEQIEEWVSKLSDNIPSLVNSGAKILTKISGSIIESLPLLLDAAFEIINSLASYLAEGDNAQKLADSAVGLVVKIAEGIEKWLPQLTPLIYEIILTIEIALIKSIPKLVETALSLGWSVIESIFAGMASGFEVYKSQFVELFGDTELYKGVSNLANSIIEFFQNAFDTVVEIWSSIPKNFSEIIENIKHVMENLPEIISSFFSLAFTLIVTTWNEAYSYFSQIFSQVTGIFSQIPITLSGLFNSAWRSIKNAFSGWNEFFSGLVNDVKSIFSNIGDFFWDVGSDIVNSIRNGISNAWNSFSNWFENLWDSLFGNRSVEVDINGNDNTSRRLRSVDGSCAKGLNYVPYDGFVAELHEGEMILTSDEAKKYRASSGITVIQNIYSEAKNAAELMQEARNQQRKAVLLGV